MNPGYLSFILICVVLILLASGWKDILFRGFSRTSILLFFVGWLVFGAVRFSFRDLHIQGTLPFLLLLSLAGTWKMKTFIQRGHVWSAGLMLGLVDVLMRELEGWSALAHSVSLTHSALIIALLAIVMGRSPLWQFIAISAGLVLAELLFGWLHRGSLPGRLAGGAQFADHWWYTFCLARGLTVAGESAARLLGLLKRRTKR